MQKPILAKKLRKTAFVPLKPQKQTQEVLDKDTKKSCQDDEVEAQDNMLIEIESLCNRCEKIDHCGVEIKT